MLKLGFLISERGSGLVRVPSQTQQSYQLSNSGA